MRPGAGQGSKRLPTVWSRGESWIMVPTRILPVERKGGDDSEKGFKWNQRDFIAFMFKTI